MVPTVVSDFVRKTRGELTWQVRRAQFALSRHAVALDRTIADFAVTARQVWHEWFAAWPPREQPVFRPVLVKSHYDWIELDRLERPSRHVSPMTRGRWR